MKQGNLPKQEYKLISMCMQGVENGIAYSCSDCGRRIFNFAIIKGEMRKGNMYECLTFLYPSEIK